MTRRIAGARAGTGPGAWIPTLPLLACLLMFGAAGAASAQLDDAGRSTLRRTSSERPPQAPDIDDAIRRLSLSGRYVQIPVIGRIGSDVAPEGFEALAAKRSSLRGATAFVVEIDSDGGSDQAALRIAESLIEIGKEVPVILVVQRAIGPAAWLLPAGHRVFIPEPAPAATLIAFQPEFDPRLEESVARSIENFQRRLAERLQRSPRGGALEPIATEPKAWQLTARQAYAVGIAEPLEGGVTALGRAMRKEPWIFSGRQVEDLLRQSALYQQQRELYRARVIARAFTSLEASNATLGQIAGAMQTAAESDPRVRSNEVPVIRLNFEGGAWHPTSASIGAWQRACDIAIANWRRVLSFGEAARQHLLSVRSDLVALEASHAESDDPGIKEAMARIESELAELLERLAAMQPRFTAAREEIEALGELRERQGNP
ncbi:MAG: hypothetical protein KF724_05645 [Phycisphaeraceae bacterium]|nr:hypothetical protein [Phycisphaeraceae bacterium]